MDLTDICDLRQTDDLRMIHSLHAFRDPSLDAKTSSCPDECHVETLSWEKQEDKTAKQ